MNADEYLVFDFETSGLDPRNDRIIQVGICHVTNGETANRQSWLVKQNVHIHPDAEHLHGITVDRLQEHGITIKPLALRPHGGIAESSWISAKRCGKASSERRSRKVERGRAEISVP